MTRHLTIAIAAALLCAASAKAGDGRDSVALAAGLPSHFTWGVEAGSSIDLSGNDLSSIDISAFFGYRCDYLQALGVGAGIHTALGNSNTMIPVYALARVSFAAKPRLCFLEGRVGYSVNTLEDDCSQNGIYFSAGVGFNLYQSRGVSSHIVLSYTYSELTPEEASGYTRYEKNFNAMSVRIGVSF